MGEKNTCVCGKNTCKKEKCKKYRKIMGLEKKKKKKKD